MIFRVILYAFLAYLLYKIVFNLIIPVYKTTKQFKKGFREMHERMNDHMKEQGQPIPQNNSRPSSKKPSGDYIDFEEVK